MFRFLVLVFLFLGYFISNQQLTDMTNCVIATVRTNQFVEHLLVNGLTPDTTSHSGVLWLVVLMIGLLLCQLNDNSLLVDDE